MKSRSGSRTLKGRSSSASTMLKTVVFAPIPRASATTATSVKPGFFHIIRKP
jgi:hypothetical protein